MSDAAAMAALLVFTRARLDEVEELAQAAVCTCGGPICTLKDGWMRGDEAQSRFDHGGEAEHIQAWSPARAVRWAQMMRTLLVGVEEQVGVETQTGAALVLCVANVFTEHPDWDPDWSAW